MHKQAAATLRLLVAALLFVSLFTLYIPSKQEVKAAPLLGNRYVQISNPTVSATAEYTVGFTVNETSTPLGSVKIDFCSNDPLPESPCVPSSGIDLTGATLATQTGNTGFSIHPSSDANTIILTRFPILPINAASTYTFTNVVNPDNNGSHFMRLQTFASDDATGGVTEEGGAVFTMLGGLSVNSEVPPYLKLCAGTSIVSYDCSTATTFLLDLGEFSTSSTSAATSEMVVATNADFGFSVTMVGTTMTSGNNVVTELNTPTVSSPGNSQFGVNLRANTNPSVGSDPVGPGVAAATADYDAPNLFKFTSNDVIVSGTGTSDDRKFTMSYIVNVDPSQPAGIYATTLSFICLANF